MARVAGTITRTCLDCKLEKKETLFYARKKGVDGNWNRASRCITCQSAYRKKWGEANRETLLVKKRQDYLDNRTRYLSHAVRKHLSNFDLTKEDYDLLVSLGCTICKAPDSGARRLSFDHNHETGKFRGLLCGNCNTALGLMYDDIDRLEKAINYLKENL